MREKLGVPQLSPREAMKKAAHSPRAFAIGRSAFQCAALAGLLEYKRQRDEMLSGDGQVDTSASLWQRELRVIRGVDPKGLIREAGKGAAMGVAKAVLGG